MIIPIETGIIMFISGLAWAHYAPVRKWFTRQRWLEVYDPDTITIVIAVTDFLCILLIAMICTLIEFTVLT